MGGFGSGPTTRRLGSLTKSSTLSGPEFSQ